MMNAESINGLNLQVLGTMVSHADGEQEVAKLPYYQNIWSGVLEKVKEQDVTDKRGILLA